MYEFNKPREKPIMTKSPSGGDVCKTCDFISEPTTGTEGVRG
jgi:hypothetical protein